MSAGNYVEAVMVLEGRRLGSREDLDEWLALRRVEIVPVDLPLARLAADAFVRFGRGRHPAGLNYGDCFAYALAKHLRAPLLFKGDDFARTDIQPALT
jgi:ribonuclease VapC